jgi:hypothetical protein
VIEIVAGLQQGANRVVRRIADRYTRIHVEQEARDSLCSNGIEKTAELRQCDPLIVRENELFVGVDGERPVTATERIKQLVCPRESIVALGVAAACRKDVHVRLAAKVVKRSVGRAVVEGEEAAHAQ